MAMGKETIRRLSISKDSVLSAREAGLICVEDCLPGIRRIRNGKGFRYLSPEGKVIRREETLQRIRALAIPPAWTDVWICAKARGHLQATGRDARGRKQHRYHPAWREFRDTAKYASLLAFAQALPRLRAQVARDLRRPGLPREKVLALVVRLLECTLIRIGNDEYARTNRSFGLTTLRDRHAQISEGEARFRFLGKSGVCHTVTLRDRRLAQIVQACQELPGQELFQYLDDEGQARDIGSADVNAYLRDITGADFTAKDFRTWAGTVLAAQRLHGLTYQTKNQALRNLTQVVTDVAQRLGNTKTVCRKCYIHPALLEAYMDGTLPGTLKPASGGRRTCTGLSPEERSVQAFLSRCARSTSPPRARKRTST